MGIKGFYGYCTKNVPDSHKTVNIIEEIEKYKSEFHENPKIMINLWTLSYFYHIKTKDLLCGYQLNKIKSDVEAFFAKMKSAGADLIFVFKKVASDDNEFLKRRLEDFREALQLIKQIEKIGSFDKLMKASNKYKGRGVPYNILILLSMIQSAQKYGEVHGANTIYCKPSVLQAELATKLNVKWILGLDTYYFLVPGSFKIWTEDKLNMTEMTVEEYDKETILQNFGLDYDQMQLLGCLSGDLQTPKRVAQKISDFFGTKSKYDSLKTFVKKIAFPLTDEILSDVADKILGKNYNPLIIEDIKKSLATYKKNENVEHKIDPEILAIIKDDFMSFAEELLLNETPIIITPTYLNLASKDMVNFNTLVLPWIQKTAGILLKNSDDKSPRKITMLESNDGKFAQVDLEVIYPDFEVPDLKVLLKGEMSTMDLFKMLFWVVGIELSDTELMAFPQNCIVDCLILLYLVKQNSLTTLDARCILKTLVESRNCEDLLKCSTEYPSNINSRALRCTFLYTKCYFVLHSCLACLGMKNYCPEIAFDGVFFQKMYFLNILDEDPENVENQENNDKPTEAENKENVEFEIIPNDGDRQQTEIVDLFIALL